MTFFCIIIIIIIIMIIILNLKSTEWKFTNKILLFLSWIFCVSKKILHGFIIKQMFFLSEYCHKHGKNRLHIRPQPRVLFFSIDIFFVISYISAQRNLIHLLSQERIKIELISSFIKTVQRI